MSTRWRSVGDQAFDTRPPSWRLLLTPRDTVSTPKNAPRGLLPYAPGAPRSSRPMLPETRISTGFVPVGARQPTEPDACTSWSSSFDTRSPLAGAMPVNPSDRVRSPPSPHVQGPLEPEA